MSTPAADRCFPGIFLGWLACLASKPCRRGSKAMASLRDYFEVVPGKWVTEKTRKSKYFSVWTNGISGAFFLSPTCQADITRAMSSFNAPLPLWRPARPGSSSSSYYKVRYVGLNFRHGIFHPSKYTKRVSDLSSYPIIAIMMLVYCDSGNVQ